jgi:hypothetical protein
MSGVGVGVGVVSPNPPPGSAVPLSTSRAGYTPD